MLKRILLIIIPVGTAVLLLILFWPRSSPVSAIPLGTGVFYDSGQTYGNNTSQAVAAADLNGDHIPDIFIANQGGNRVYLNQGNGQLSAGGSLGNANSLDVALGDLDGDYDIDALTANSGSPNQIWLNQGNGQFSVGESLADESSRGVALGDVDGDGDLDAYFANTGTDSVWFNQGGLQGGLTGVFEDSGQTLDGSSGNAVALADLDHDGDLDAFVVNGLSGTQPDTVWINQGGVQGGSPGIFADSGQTLGVAWSYSVALGDLNGDNHPDAFTASWFPAGNKIWLNDGNGNFSDSGASLGSVAALGVRLGDLSGDQVLDAFVANNTPDGGQVWLNDGAAHFTNSGQTLGTNTTTYDGALADLDGDGDLDILAANFGPNQFWLNGNPGLPEAVFDVPRQVNDQGVEVYFSASGGNALLPILLGHPITQTVQVHALIQEPATTLSQTLTFDPGEQVMYLNLVDPNPDPSHIYTLTLSITLPGDLPTPANQTDQLLFAFVDQDQGLTECILCYVEWLGQQVGIDPIFDHLFHLTLYIRPKCLLLLPSIR